MSQDNMQRVAAALASLKDARETGVVVDARFAAMVAKAHGVPAALLRLDPTRRFKVTVSVSSKVATEIAATARKGAYDAAVLTRTVEVAHDASELFVDLSVPATPCAPGDLPGRGAAVWLLFDVPMLETLLSIAQANGGTARMPVAIDVPDIPPGQCVALAADMRFEAATRGGATT